jgi:hypothetical protein
MKKKLRNESLILKNNYLILKYEKKDNYIKNIN